MQPLDYQQNHNMQRGNLKRAQKENKGAYQNRNGNLCLIQNMQQYQRALTPVIDKQNQRKVQKKVKLDNYARERLMERQAENDLYLNYNLNPFVLLKKKQKKNLIKEIKNNKQEILQVVELMTPYEKNQRRIKKSMTEQLKQLRHIKLDAELKSQRTINMVHNYQHEKQKQKAKKNKKLQNIVQSKEPQQNRDIQEILQIKQNRYIFEREQKPNIFKLLQDDNCISMLDHIEKRKFCFNSHIQRNYKLRIPIFRELSTMGRRISTNCYTGKQKILDYVFSDELTLNMKDVSFNDLLSVANNRLSCQYIYNKLYEENSKPANEVSDELSEEQDLEFNNRVIFRKTDRVRPDNFVAGNEEIEEISAYKKIQLTDNQEKFKKKNEETRNQIIEQLERQTQLCLNNIMDMRLHSTMGNNVKQKLRNFMVSKENKNEQFERLVRQKKTTSNKKQLIKLREFKKMLDERNKMFKIKTEVSRGKLNQTMRL